MVRRVLVFCVCDFCGKTVYCRANYNHFYDLYEDGLPEGWQFIDGEEYRTLSRTGDHCSDCLSSFEKYIQSCCSRWIKYVRFRSNHIPPLAHNDMADNYPSF